MINYQKEMEKVLNCVPQGEPLLLHACCGPCTSSVLEVLGAHFSVTVLYYNPNIAPQTQWQRRLDALRSLLEQLPTRYPARLLEPVYDPKAFAAAAAGLEGEAEGGARCAACFSLRLGEAARQAKALGFERFTTTLSVSPHKNAALLNQIGSEAAEKHGVLWLPSDFKKKGGYQRSIELCREYGIYRQAYCGCVYGSAGN